ncbi:NAD(P)/FAD-dependent oxidoreductase [Brevundimonas lutea]|uniref:NAD(P)/FAD-dependent oxidoreductase n=1 Tax=Brevundimonas lutea TaxID=2293980 RepID=UPI000F0218EC|nr:FAD-dependent monooxygenase [Brevundimonas lutea]
MTGPVAVVGGGLAGASAAVRLATAGRAVVLFERTTGPHDKVCGEFLSFEAIEALREIGLEPRALGAVPIDRVTVCVGGRRTTSTLPFEALSLSRRVLDEALLELAERSGVEVRRGKRVRALAPCAQGWALALAAGAGTLTASDVFLATGKHEVRGYGRPPGGHDDLIGFKLHLAPPASLRDAVAGEVSLHLFDGGYAGLEPIEGDLANLCLVVRKARFAALGLSWPRLVESLARTCPFLAPVLGSSKAGTAKPLAIAAIPYGHVQSAAEPGLWRLGDQAAVIPSFAGEGMAIALHSGRLAADRLLSGASSGVYQRALATDVGRRVRGATWLSRAMVTGPGRMAASALLAAVPSAPVRIGLWTRLPTRVATGRQARLEPV